MRNNFRALYDQNEKREIDIKCKKEQLVSSLFEIEKFLCRINTTKKCSNFAKIIKNC